jgi:hypothetical protein
MNARVRLEHRLIAVDHDERLHVMLEIDAPKDEDAPEAPPMSLALVLDRSGSMSGRKLEVARSCALWLAERMAAKDRLGLVAFDHEVMVFVGPQTSSSERVRSALRMVGARGSTNLSRGWMKAFELLNEPGFSGPRRVLLLTDGLANVGVTEPEELVAMARSAAEQGVVTTTIGFGEGFDENLLTRMADAGRGSAHFAASPEDAPEVFAEEAGDLAALVAQNLSVEIRPTSSVSGMEILGDYQCATVAGGVVDNHGSVVVLAAEELVEALREVHEALVVGVLIGGEEVGAHAPRGQGLEENDEAHDLALRELREEVVGHGRRNPTRADVVPLDLLVCRPGVAGQHGKPPLAEGRPPVGPHDDASDGEGGVGWAP